MADHRSSWPDDFPSSARPQELPPWRLDLDRRVALQHLIGWLTDLIDATDVLTDAALRSDHEAFVKAGADVRALAASPTPDLTELTEIYNGLRLAIVTRQSQSADRRRPPSPADAPTPVPSEAPVIRGWPAI